MFELRSERRPGQKTAVGSGLERQDKTITGSETYMQRK